MNPPIQFDTSKRGVLVVTSPRSGTHLTIDLLRRNFPTLCAKKRRFAALDTVYVPVDTFFLDASSTRARRRAAKTLQRLDYPILKTHWLAPDFQQLRESEPVLVKWLESNVKTIYVSRSPEQALSSMYLFEQEFSPPLEIAQRDEWLALKSQLWNHHVLTWLNKEDVLHLRFDDIMKCPEQTLERIAAYLGLGQSYADPILPPRIKSHWHGRLLRLSSNPGSTEIVSSRPRKTLAELFSASAISKMQDVVKPARDLVQRQRTEPSTNES